MRALLRSTFLAASCCAALALSGCANNFSPKQDTNVDTSTVTMTGEVFGGFFPVSGAKVFLFSPGTTGVGGASTSLISSTTTGSAIDTTNGSITNGARYVLTTSNGGFSFTSTCTEGNYVYLYAAAGVATTGGASNPQIGLMSVVGLCPASGTVDAVPFVRITENTTVAAAYALAGYATDPGHISYTGTSLGLVGLGNAFGTATNLFNQLVAVNSTASVNGFGAATTKSGSTGTIPQTLLNTLSNILVACVNSGNSASATTGGCNMLRENATSTGTATTGPTAPATGSFGSTAPDDTATAMINIAHHPFANISTIFGLQGTGANNLYKPSLSAAPTSFVVEVKYTGGGLSIGSLRTPRQIAIDGTGNVWELNYLASNVGKFSPLGVPAASSGYTVSAANQTNCPLTGTEQTKLANAIAIDVSGNAWIGFSQDLNALCELNASGAFVFGLSLGATDGNNTGVFDLGFDTSGNAWIADNEPNTEAGAVYEVSGTTHALLTTINSTTADGLDFPYGIAINSTTYNGDIWVANCQCEVNGNTGSNAGDTVLTPAGANATFSPTTAGSISEATGVAIDSSGYVWSLTFPGLSKTSPTGSSTGSGYYNFPSLDNEIAIAMDGASNVWVDNNDMSIVDLAEVSNAGALLTPSAGFVPIGATTANYPDGLAIDGSGNVWYQMTDDYTLRQLVGAAVPVATPIAYGTANNKLGARP